LLQILSLLCHVQKWRITGFFQMTLTPIWLHNIHLLWSNYSTFTRLLQTTTYTPSTHLLSKNQSIEIFDQH
jgi:hypothetical protein